MAFYKRGRGVEKGSTAKQLQVVVSRFIAGLEPAGPREVPDFCHAACFHRFLESGTIKSSLTLGKQ